MRLRITPIHVAAVLALQAWLCESACSASVHVYYLDSSGAVVQPGISFPGGDPVQISINTSTIAHVMVYSDDASNDSIGTISIGGTQTQAINLYVAKTRIDADAVYTQASTQAAGVNFGGLQGVSPARDVHLKVFVTGNVTGSITVSHLETLQALGQLQSRIQSESGGNFIVRGGSATSGVQYMEQANGVIKEVRITSGDASFDILAPNGSIGVVSIGGIFGDINSALYPDVTAGTSIDRVEAAGIRANIAAGTGIKFIRTTTSGIKGSITTPTILEQAPGVGGIFDITGNFEPTMTLSQGLPANATIRCATWFGDEPGSCTPILTLQGTDRLAGQIIVNAENNATVGKWYQPVLVDGTTDYTLGPDASLSCSGSDAKVDYVTPSASVGGGAVGVVPYHFYPQDCAFPSGSTFFDSAFNHRNPGGSSGNNRTITLRFYGPVFQNDSDPAIKIEQDLGGWVDVTNRGVITLGSATSGNPREITIHGTDGTTGKIPFLPGTYRITGVAGKLKCGGTLADPVPDAQTNFTYDFSLASDCNKNNRDDATDLAETVTYEGDTYHPYNLDENDFIDACDRETHGTCPADIDGNGFINALDYDWFAVLFEIGHPLADIDANGFVNALDYDLFSGLFETACQ